jgi:hypothetical protein
MQNRKRRAPHPARSNPVHHVKNYACFHGGLVAAEGRAMGEPPTENEELPAEALHQPTKDLTWKRGAIRDAGEKMSACERLGPNSTF